MPSSPRQSGQRLLLVDRPLAALEIVPAVVEGDRGQGQNPANLYTTSVYGDLNVAVGSSPIGSGTLGLPRIDDLQAQVFKVPHVTSDQGKIVLKGGRRICPSALLSGRPSNCRLPSRASQRSATACVTGKIRPANSACQGRSKFGPLRRSKRRPVGEGVAVFVGRLERSLRSPFRAAQA